jgi:hypothetical protein
VPVSLLKHVEEAALVLLPGHVAALSLFGLSLLELESLLLLKEFLLLLRDLGRLVGANRSLARLLRLLRLLLLYRELNEVVQLLLRMEEVLGVGWHELLQEFVVLLLELKGHAEVLLEIVGVGNGLIALHDLEVRVSVEGYVSVETISEAFNSSWKLVAVLVHEAEVEDHGGRVWVLVAADNLQNTPRPIKVLETF